VQNLRDGLEDLEWWDLLRRLVTRAKAAGVDVAQEAEALTVPDSLFSHVQPERGPENFTYSQEPSALRVARDTLGAAILSVQKKLDSDRVLHHRVQQQHREAEAWLKNATTQIMSECRLPSTNPNTSDWVMFSPNAQKHYKGQWMRDGFYVRLKRLH
jgi:hypothetical protein